MEIKKISEREFLNFIQPGAVLLGPLVVRSRQNEFRDEKGWYVDMRVELSLAGEGERFPFAVEGRTQNTPAAVRDAVEQVRREAKDEQPMIIVPYLSPE